MANAIEARGLTKRFGEVEALAGLDLDVPTGTILGLLGPNGAGKTTAVRILATLLPLDEGSATVAGIDVAGNPDEVRKVIGLSGQYAAVDENLTGFENLEMIGRLYQMPKAEARARADTLLGRFGLTDAAHRPSKQYSGGMRRRLDLAGAVVAAPKVLFLDEPTTGLDPPSRLELWSVIRELVSAGTTLLLTTQYMDEADQLADNIIVIDHGREIAQGTSDELKRRVGGERVEFVVTDRERVADAMRLATQVGEQEPVLKEATRRITSSVTGRPAMIALLQRLEEASIEVTDFGMRRPTLDDVFLTLTGHATADDDSTAEVS